MQRRVIPSALVRPWRIVEGSLSIYQRFVSPTPHILGRALFGSSYACRFSPTCSEYLATAVAKYGIIHGGFLGLRRLFKCHPYSSTPHLDPVPENLKS